MSLRTCILSVARSVHTSGTEAPPGERYFCTYRYANISNMNIGMAPEQGSPWLIECPGFFILLFVIYLSV